VSETVSREKVITRDSDRIEICEWNFGIIDASLAKIFYRELLRRATGAVECFDCFLSRVIKKAERITVVQHETDAPQR
jgi:hypothetical protein